MAKKHTVLVFEGEELEMRPIRKNQAREEALTLISHAYADMGHNGGQPTSGSEILLRIARRIAPRITDAEVERLERIRMGSRQEEESGWWNAR